MMKLFTYLTLVVIIMLGLTTLLQANKDTMHDVTYCLLDEDSMSNVLGGSDSMCGETDVFACYDAFASGGSDCEFCQSGQIKEMCCAIPYSPSYCWYDCTELKCQSTPRWIGTRYGDLSYCATCTSLNFTQDGNCLGKCVVDSGANICEK